MKLILTPFLLAEMSLSLCQKSSTIYLSMTGRCTDTVGVGKEKINPEYNPSVQMFVWAGVFYIRQRQISLILDALRVVISDLGLSAHASVLGVPGSYLYVHINRAEDSTLHMPIQQYLPLGWRRNSANICDCLLEWNWKAIGPFHELKYYQGVIKIRWDILSAWQFHLLPLYTGYNTVIAG